MKAYSALIALALPGILLAQQPATPKLSQAQPAPAAAVPLPTVADFLKAIKGRSLGPTTMGGRVSEFAVYEKKPQIFYIASASGGLWRTNNGGLTTEPVFQYETSAALGAVAVNPDNPDDVWVGTGEQNSRNSTSWGDGVYRTKDGGKTWAHLGLVDSKHISRIQVDPHHPDTAYVGAMGPLWGKGGSRGVFKTTDGGKTWANVLPGDDRIGTVELQMDPSNPNVLYAGMYARSRTAWSFSSGGPGGGLYKTTDGGKTWTKLTKGLPTSTTGRVGISIYRKNPRIVMACVEAETGGGIFRSEDGGASWTRTSNIDYRPFYFSQIRIDPSNDQNVYLSGVSFHASTDGGKTFRVFPTTVHVDHHAIWVDPKDGDHLLIGEDGGAAQTRDHGKTWQHLNTLCIAQFYAVCFDFRKPYYVYGGLQDNGSWGGPTETTHGGVTFQDWFNVGGGDGFWVQADPEDWRIIYSESQGGAMTRMNVATGEQRFIRPNAKPGERLRFNWDTPIYISPWNASTVYVGANKLFRSVDRGDNWKAISPDLTTDNPFKEDPHGGVTPEDTGAERHCTIISISESPSKQGVIWAGTDDGNVQVTQDDGQHWEEVGHNIKGLPPYTWCSRVDASHFASGRAYATFDGHRNNDYKPYVFMTDDFGKTWKPLTNGLKENDCCYVVREGLQNSDLLFLGTEMGLYVSMDRGANWTKFHKDSGFPTVRIDDCIEHPRDHDLIVGTHGRAIWQIPVGALEQMADRSFNNDAILFRPDTAYSIGRNGGFPGDGDGTFVSQNSQPTSRIFFYLKSAPTDRVSISIQDSGGTEVGGGSFTAVAGLNLYTWSPSGGFGRRRRSGASATGDYTCVLKVNGKEYKTGVRVEDVNLNQ